MIAIAACASRAAPTSAAVSSHALANNEPGVAPNWSIASNGGRAVTIADGAVIVQTGQMVDRQALFGVAVFDIASGKELWHRDGPLPIRGTPLFLTDSSSLERVDIHTGNVLWRSQVSCLQDNQRHSYVKVISESVYAGCSGGSLFRLNLADGRVLASQGQISVDDYQQIELLPHAALAVSGYASIGMYTRSAVLHAQSLQPIEPLQLSTPDLDILGVRNDEAIVADVCCRGTPDTNSPGAIWGVSLTTGDTRWSTAIRPYHPPLPLSDVEPGAGIFVLASDRLYVGTRTALFVYHVDDLRALGSKASRREIYSDLRDRPEVYDGRYLGISEGDGATVRRSALFDTVTARELWSDASRPWSAPPPQLQTSTVAEMYSVMPGDRRFSLIRLNDGKMLPIDTGCYLQAADERYAVTLCARRGRLPELALFDFDSGQNVAALPSEAPVAQTTGIPQVAAPTIDPLLARWTQHQWNLIGSTGQTYFFGREPNGIVAISRKSGAVAWQNDSVCSVARLAVILKGILYVACPETIAILDRADGRAVHKRSLGIYGFNAIVPAGDSAVVVEGWNDGAALRSDMAILDKNTLKPISDRQMSDSTYLGVIGDRAYIDDWCCFGRADQYRPATIYSISLKDGSTTEPVDLYPEPDLHPVGVQPLGQGERNYLEGGYFYVVTPNYTYRYDLVKLGSRPVRTVTPSNSPGSPK
jgi:outer membrane protein assembly factor BamB